MVQMDEAAVNLPHEYYPAIGEFVFRFAQLEYLLHELTWRCIDIDNKQGRTLTIGTDLNVVLGYLNTITHANRWVTSNHVTGEIGNVCAVADKYRSLRNQIAHGSWQFPKNGDKTKVRMHYMKESADHRMIPRHKTLPPEHFHLASGKLKGAIERAKRLIAEIERDRPPRAPQAPV